MQALLMLRKLGAGPAIFSSTFAEDNLYYVFMWLVFLRLNGLRRIFTFGLFS